MQRCRELGTYHGFDSMGLDSDTCSKEILDNLTPMLQGIKITVQKPRAHRRKRSDLDSTAVPVACGSSG